MRGFTTVHYPELLAYRNEGLRKVGARFTDQIGAPPARCFYPTFWHSNRASDFPSVSLGPWRAGAAGPSMIVAHEATAHRASVKVLDVGCAAGSFRSYLELRDPARTIEYYGVDVAPATDAFPIYPSIASVGTGAFDLVFMSEIAEHMPADTFAEEYLRPVAALLKPGGVAIVGVPNPLAPTALQRDITHVQHYPWYDLYALLRFFFTDVDVIRTHFVYGPRRLLSLPLKMSLSYFLETDWCEGVTAIARGPRKT